MATDWAKTLLPIVFFLQTAFGQVMYDPRSPVNAKMASQIYRAGRQTNIQPPGNDASIQRTAPIPNGVQVVQLQPGTQMVDPRQQIPMQTQSMQRNYMPSILSPRTQQPVVQAGTPIAYNPGQAVPLSQQYIKPVPNGVETPQKENPQSSASAAQNPPSQLPQTSDLPLQNLASEDPSQNSKREIFYSDNPCNDAYQTILNNILPVGKIPSYPDVTFKNEDFSTIPCSCGKSPNPPSFCANPYLPIASPISALYSPLSGLLPPANYKQPRCNYLRKIPISPPMI